MYEALAIGREEVVAQWMPELRPYPTVPGQHRLIVDRRQPIGKRAAGSCGLAIYSLF